MILDSETLTNSQIIFRQDVRNAYNSPDGKRELFRLLTDIGMFRPITAEELPLRNYGIQKLTDLGFLDENVIYDTLCDLFNKPLLNRLTAEEMARDNNIDKGLLRVEGEENA